LDDELARDSAAAVTEAGIVDVPNGRLTQLVLGDKVLVAKIVHCVDMRI